ncbi:Kelch motif family protein [Histomonas meleagridis]|uniref:Kelch motif family protein n=1 Tax=Histomonas meleagridis TaxID=135588 RepID=UPI003559C144|nr:Kelch motif family protein [Histomonas meleagridis]KAH0799042.1 Kelch motif family protein [Histomonas meleagridis]
MTDIPISLGQQYICSNDQVYIVASSKDGYLKVYNSSLNSKVKEVEIKGSSPSNRSNFSCTAINDTAIILIGGDGFGIHYTEIWKFDIKKSSWTQLTTTQPPAKILSNHRSAANGNIIYVYGGFNGLNISTTMLIYTINENTYTYNEIEHRGDFPCPRTGHTMIPFRNSIWLYGGLAHDRTPLGDLWQLDYSLFPENPKWNLIENKRFPPCRHDSVSFIQGDVFYIAGGIGAENQFYNEVWKYKDEWEQVSIVDCDSPLIGCSLGLLQVSDTLTVVKQNEPFSALDDLFDKLRLKEREYHLNSENDNEFLNNLKKENASLRSMIGQLEKYSNDKNSPINEIKEYFSEEKKKNLIKKTTKLREELSEIASEVILKYPNFIKPIPNSLAYLADQIEIQLTLKLQQSQYILEKTKKERKMEIDLYKQQIKILNSKGNLEIPNIDVGDFSTFQQFSESLPKSQQEVALNAYYRMQLREYQRLIQQIQTVHKKSKKVSDRQAIYKESLSRLSDELNIKFKTMSLVEEELRSWDRRLKDIKNDIQKVTDFLGAIKQYNTDKRSLDQKVETLEEKITKLQQKYKTDVEDMSNNKKGLIEELLKLLNTLSDSIKNRSNEDAKRIIDAEYPNIQKLKDALIPKKQ